VTWADLSPGWRSAWAQSWEAYQTGNIPVGAAIINPAGEVLAVGRNRTREARNVSGVISGHDLAHAEVNALLALPALPRELTQTLTLLTTVEPCPQCAGTLVMNPVRRLSYAAADPWAGSADLLRDHPYMSLKMLEVTRGPDGMGWASALLLILQAWEDGVFQRLFREKFEAALPDAVRAAEAFGTRLNRDLDAETAYTKLLEATP
jgi:tRNA(adenine34) deaminase